MFDFIRNISPLDLIIILAIVLFLFGGKILAKLGKKSGETVKEIKKATDEFTQTIGMDEGKVKK